MNEKHIGLQARVVEIGSCSSYCNTFYLGLDNTLLLPPVSERYHRSAQLAVEGRELCVNFRPISV